MLTRRTLLHWLTAALGGFFHRPGAAVALVAQETVPQAATCAGLEPLPCRWFLDVETGEFWQADDFFQWMDWNLPEAVMERARQGLEESIGAEQLAGLERRRRRLQHIEVRRPFEIDCDADGLPSADAYVRLLHWGTSPADVGPFLAALGLCEARTAVEAIDLKKHA